MSTLWTPLALLSLVALGTTGGAAAPDAAGAGGADALVIAFLGGEALAWSADDGADPLLVDVSDAEERANLLVRHGYETLRRQLPAGYLGEPIVLEAGVVQDIIGSCIQIYDTIPPNVAVDCPPVQNLELPFQD